MQNSTENSARNVEVSSAPVWKGCEAMRTGSEVGQGSHMTCTVLRLVVLEQEEDDDLSFCSSGVRAKARTGDNVVDKGG